MINVLWKHECPCVYLFVIKGSHVGNAERWRCGGGLWLHLSVRYTSREASGCSELVPSCGEAIENWRRQFFESPGCTMVYLKNGNPQKIIVKDVCSILITLCHCLPCNILWLQILQQHGTMLSTSSIGAKYHLRKERWLQLLQPFWDVFLPITGFQLFHLDSKVSGPLREFQAFCSFISPLKSYKIEAWQNWEGWLAQKWRSWILKFG